MTNWVTVATEQFSDFNYVGVVRIGNPAYPNNWVSKTFSGAGVCNTGGFGNIADPAPGLYKQCQIQLSAPNVVQTGTAPVINTALIQPPQRAWSVDRIGTGAGFDQGPYPDGAFRTNCDVSHFSFDDPIVLPGQPGKSHLHMFMGNTGTNASSTASSIANAGNSTCNGGTANRTAYWVPAVVNLKTGAPVVPMGVNWYYKSAKLPASSIKPMPQGLRMIAGDSKATSASQALFGCDASSTSTTSFPNCAVGDVLNVMLFFPQCWDGVNLDSPDHKSHMAYAVSGSSSTGAVCPSSHPVPVVELSFHIRFMVTEARPDLNWKLSSDNYSGPSGYSMHGDWFNGWKDDVLKTWTSKCVNTSGSSSNALCDGRWLN